MSDRRIIKVMNKTHCAWNMFLYNKLVFTFSTMHWPFMCLSCLLFFLQSSLVKTSPLVEFSDAQLGWETNMVILIFFVYIFHSKKLGIFSFFSPLDLRGTIARWQQGAFNISTQTIFQGRIYSEDQRLLIFFPHSSYFNGIIEHISWSCIINVWCHSADISSLMSLLWLNYTPTTNKILFFDRKYKCILCWRIISYSFKNTSGI